MDICPINHSYIHLYTTAYQKISLYQYHPVVSCINIYSNHTNGSNCNVNQPLTRTHKHRHVFFFFFYIYIPIVTLLTAVSKWWFWEYTIVGITVLDTQYNARVDMLKRAWKDDWMYTEFRIRPSTWSLSSLFFFFFFESCKLLHAFISSIKTICVYFRCTEQKDLLYWCKQRK